MHEDLDDLAKRLKTDASEQMKLYKLWDDDNSSGIQDVLGAAKYLKGNYEEISSVRYKWHHSAEYWTKRGQTKQGQKYTEEKVAKELFAHISSAQVSQKEMEYIKEYFPRALEKFNNVIEEIASKM